MAEPKDPTSGRGRLEQAPARALRAATRGPRLFGLAVVALFVGGGGTWATLAPLASAALAPGVVSPEGSRRTVQHLEGGIIRAIHVRDGSPVKRGQPLVTLEDTQARARHGALLAEYLALIATEARLVAEQRREAEIVLPDELVARRSDDPTAHRLIRSQHDLFMSRREARVGRERILAQRVARLEAENRGLDKVITAQDEQLQLLDAESSDVEGLLNMGLERKPRLLVLRRERAEVVAERAENLTRIASNEQAIGEAELQLATEREEDQAAIDAELSEIRARLARVRPELPASEDMLARTVISAPTAGTVFELRFTTAGGVIGPGEAILDLVPAEARLLIEARVRPHDIDDVSIGQKAKVTLSGYKQRNLPQIRGTVRDVSADRLVDDRTGEPYFLARVLISRKELARIAERSGIDVTLAAGMPAEVTIVTGERTALDYLIQPLRDSLRRSFKER